MKLSELKKIIDRTLEYSPTASDCEVCIPIYGENTVGATPNVKIRSANKGFDWDGHLFILTPEIRVHK